MSEPGDAQRGDDPNVSGPMEARIEAVSPLVRARVPAHVADVEAFVATAFDLYAERLKGFAIAATRDRDTADDLVQESFFRLIAEVRRSGAPDNARAWLFRVCGNLIVSRGRRMSVAARLKGLLLERGVAASPEDTVIRRDEDARLVAALGRLPPDGRVALLLAAQGLSAAEIGAAIGRTPNATRTHLCRTRLRLHELVDEPGEAR